MSNIEGIDLKALNSDQLTRLIAGAQAELVRQSEAAREAVRLQMEDLATRAGFSLEEILGRVKGKRATGKKVAPKYCNPGEASQTWTGRGRKPVWVTDLLASGKSLDDLLIK